MKSGLLLYCTNSLVGRSYFIFFSLSFSVELLLLATKSDAVIRPGKSLYKTLILDTTVHFIIFYCFTSLEKAKTFFRSLDNCNNLELNRKINSNGKSFQVSCSKNLCLLKTRHERKCTRYACF